MGTEPISEDVKRLVLARIESMPEHMKLSFGSDGEFDKYALISQVEQETEIGKKIVEMHLMYLRSFKNPVMI